ncbi:hypothetical protein SPI_04431 [Niveomyces insectorum RCEF 264]|uniref:Rhodopsin domain-containing protein n=1 Tax=Niveomyces insectorum RCEF 264 TaxID=1081102 RepID=A0A167VQW0_9HYPO|nr:hypothetical protein SPI_04431 [Niveomyces insectorum RCEF 264]
MECPAGDTACKMVSGDDLGPMLRVGLWVLTTLSFAFLVTRLVCKFKRHRTFHVDDYVLVASWLMFLGSVICTTVEIAYGFGKHSFDNVYTAGEVDKIALIGSLTVTLGICAQVWSKTSWAITLLRVSTGSLRWFMWFALVSMNLFFAVPAFAEWLQCQPIEKAWHPLLPGTCWSPRVSIVLGIVASSYSGVLDLAFAIIPWMLLRNLHVSPGEKLGVALAMSMGVFAAISAFIKSSAFPALASPDFSYEGVTLTLWCAAEPAVTIMAASVPMMRVLAQTARKPVSWAGASRDHLPANAATTPSDGEMEEARSMR